MLRAEPWPRDKIPDPTSPAWRDFLAQLVKESFSALRKTNTSARWKSLTPGRISLASIPSMEPKGTRLRGAHWHSRSSIHFPEETGVSFDAFADGLLHHHTENEQQYIHALEQAECLEVLVPDVASIWHLKYRTPWGTANRDFVELVITLPLLAHELPFSNFHEEVMVDALHTDSLPNGHVPHGAVGTRRSFLVISQPIAHPRTQGYVRAYYASAEGVREDSIATRADDTCVQWMLTTQTDAQGSIPQWIQEWAMPSQIAADVPAFFQWVHAKKA